MGNRTIRTKYYRNNKYAEPVKVNSSGNTNQAVATCIYYMQVDFYDASVAEVYDDESGQLHAQIRRKMNGNIEIVYKRDSRQYEARLAVGALFDKKKKV